MNRERLDQLLVRRGMAPTRAKAQALIMAGGVRVAGVANPKAGTPVGGDVSIEVIESGPTYVSRGGQKLEGACKAFRIDPSGFTCVDVGCSTGGFTDYLLQHGAHRVYAVDVGKSVLDLKFRNDPRVTVLEGLNARYLNAENIPEPVDLVTIDVAFISATHMIRAAKPLLKPGGSVLVLVKPQFELTAKDNRKGVVRDPAKHRVAVQKIKSFAAEVGLICLAETPSPLLGPKGNREFFLHLR